MLSRFHAVTRIPRKRHAVIPDQEKMISILTAFEAALDERGWDEPATLVEIFQSEGGPLLMLEMPLPMPLNTSRVDPLDALSVLADVFAKHGQAEDILKEAGPLGGKTAGIAFACEAWMPPDGYEGPEDTFADAMGAKEVRAVVAADCGGRIYKILRVRGEAPIGQVYWPEGEEPSAERVMQILLRLLKALMRYAPGDAWDKDAISKMQLRTARGTGQ